LTLAGKSLLELRQPELRHAARLRRTAVRSGP
jgi:hypothetical protein